MPFTISVVDLNRLRHKAPETLLLDVRTPVEYAGAHVPGARNTPLDGLDLADVTTSDGVERPVYLLCKSGGRAQRAADRLASAGFTQAVVVEGGTEAWAQAGLPLAHGVVQVISLERQVRIVAGSLVLLGFLLAWLIHPWFVFLSAFVGGGLVFAGLTDFCGMGLLLARAPWNRRMPRETRPASGPERLVS